MALTIHYSNAEKELIRHFIRRITGRFFDPLKMAESITELRTHESTDSRK